MSAAAAVLFGAAVTVALFGFGPLNPRNEGWLWAGLGVDPIRSWLGWASFRHSSWTLPPGANPGYRMVIGTAIYFTDSLPLLALPLKALRGVLDGLQSGRAAVYRPLAARLRRGAGGSALAFSRACHA